MQPEEFSTIILDLNGTIALDGEILPGIGERITELKKAGYNIVLFSGDTYGGAAEIATLLGIELYKTKNSEEKLEAMRNLGSPQCISIGNGYIDRLITKEAGVGIVVIGSEGAHGETMHAANVVVTSVMDAFDLLLKPGRLYASTRK
ncbi:MAG: P-type E1-E2 ATPase [Planctomycetota bacterium]|jgi:P-type E1-E2 ATPase